MTEMPSIPASVHVPKGAAESHARGFSTGMGVASGAIIGAVFGSIWSLASGKPLAVRTASLAAVGALTGAVLSGRTWQTQPRIHGEHTAPEFATRLEAERVEAPSTQAL